MVVLDDVVELLVVVLDVLLDDVVVELDDVLGVLDVLAVLDEELVVVVELEVVGVVEDEELVLGVEDVDSVLLLDDVVVLDDEVVEDEELEVVVVVVLVVVVELDDELDDELELDVLVVEVVVLLVEVVLVLVVLVPPTLTLSVPAALYNCFWTPGFVVGRLGIFTLPTAVRFLSIKSSYRAIGLTPFGNRTRLARANLHRAGTVVQLPRYAGVACGEVRHLDYGTREDKALHGQVFIARHLQSPSSVCESF